MLFNSPLFVLGFLPLTWGGFWLTASLAGQRPALGFLLAASLIFYGWWYPPFLLILLGSISVNFTILRIMQTREHQKPWLIAGLCFNLGLLALCKYTPLLSMSLNWALPLGISFFTFQQIMMLVDQSRGQAQAGSFLDYALFVAFFPHLIAGPIVRPGEIMPQLRALAPLDQWRSKLADGAEIFLLGLGKKLVLADGFARFADPGFAAAAAGHSLSLLEAWVALLAYGLQIYFDFSGYSDMAIGLARMFGIRFPLNFKSPYQALDISDFWRRWNITLSAFLRDYLYIPLGGNRHGEAARIRNLMITMLLGGLWHGAAWKFMLWGGLHGLFLVIHGWFRKLPLRLPRAFSWAITWLAVMLAWVPFRAADMAASLDMFRGLAGLQGFFLPRLILDHLPLLHGFAEPVAVLPWLGDARTLSVIQAILLLTLGWFIALALPDIHSWGARGRAWALTSGFALTCQALLFAPFVRPFLYFQF